MTRLARLGTTMLLGLLAFASGCELRTNGAPADAAVDGGPAHDAGAPPTRFDESSDVPGTCYDGLDNNDDGALDCADEGCGGLDPVCCVGSADASCCAPLSAIEMTVPDDGGCDGMAAEDCTLLGADLAFFGATEPSIRSGGLVPEGGTGFGGVVLGDGVDPRQLELSLTATVDVPATRCTGCVDAAGVALIDALPAPGLPARIRLGVLASGSRGEVLVMMGDEIVHTMPLADGALSVGVELHVDGTGRIFAGGESMALSDLVLPSELMAVVVGRTDGAGAEDTIRVRRAELARARCDVPSAIGRRGQVMPASTSTYRPARLGRASAVAAGDGSGVWVAFEDQGDIRVAHEDADHQLLGDPTEPSPPVVMWPLNVERAFDPWLRPDPDGARFVLTFAGEDGDGELALYEAESSGWTPAFEGARRVLGPEIHADVGGLDGPSVWTDADGVTRMIARAHLTDGTHAFVAFERSEVDGEAAWGFAEDTLEASIVHRPATQDRFSFEADEILAPAVVQSPGPLGSTIWRLYYGARRGTRRAIAMLASEDGAAWRSVGVVLEPSGAGFDAIGVTDPAPVIVDDRLRLYYRGTDGVRSAIGLAGPAGTVGE